MAKKRTNSTGSNSPAPGAARADAGSPVAAELLVSLRRRDGEALHRQIESALRDGIRSGRFAAGTAMPSSRRLAAGLGVSRGVVVEAYSQLTAEGYLAGRSGSFTRVAADVPAARREAEPVAAAAAPRPQVDFGYGRANVAAFPRRAWMRSLRRVFAEAPDERLGYPDGSGALELRTALADYLNRVRGTDAVAAQVVVTNGYGQGVGLLISVLAARGARRLAVEDPSADDDVRPFAARLGIEVVGVPVGEEGVETRALERLEADALVLTPSHQWPTGGVLSAEARAAIVGWARREDAIVIEDDYDAEYRYDRAPVGALQGLAPERVVYAGTASKTLAPGFRLGWFVLPPQLREPFAAEKILADRGSPVIDQLAFADFLVHGEFDRHLRRMRPLYRERRDALLGALAARLPQLRPSGVAAGLHLVAWLPSGVEEGEVIAAAARHGVAIAGVSPYRLESTGPDGLIFGYSDLAPGAISRGVALLAVAFEEVEAGSNSQASSPR
jgi:GntR family transcriptional regulator/MocR family aminotransferase